MIHGVSNNLVESKHKGEKVMEIKDAASTESATVTKEADGKPPVDAKDVKGSESSPENLPWHKDARFQDFLKEKKGLEAANAKLQKILKANDLDDPDDLEDLVRNGRVVKGKNIDLESLDEMREKAERLTKYEAYWADQKKRQERENATPEDRVEKAERELEFERGTRQREAAQKKQVEETKRAISNYEKDVRELIQEATVPKEHQSFIQELFGVGNPSNDVDITDKKAIKKLVADGMKKVDAFKQSVIAEYLKEKKGIVKTGQGSESVGGDKPPKIMLKDARKMFLERMQRSASGG
jgi:hypothetical protein